MNADSGPMGYNLTNGNDLFIGHYDGCAQHDFSRTIDEPTVWSKALTATQISYAYKDHGRTPRVGEPPAGIPCRMSNG
jgi:hypothetical protein